MTEPKYNEDVVNLGYLKRALGLTDEQTAEIYKYISKHYGSKPQPPYYKGDTWVDGTIIYTCINDRLIGTYQDSDWVTESGAKEEAERKSKVFLRQPSNYSVGDMWILQSDTDHRAGKRGEILITTAGRKVYDEDDWVNMLGYGTIRSINEVANNINDALIRLGANKESGVLTIWYADEIPSNPTNKDLWFVTENVSTYIKENVYKYNGSTWEEIEDELAIVAFSEANQARLVEDGKIQSFYSTTEPTGTLGAGDIWTDTSNNKLYRYNGTNWVAVYDTNISEIRVNLDTVTTRTTTLETDLGTITGQVTELETTTRTIENDLGDVQTDVISTIERVSTLEVDATQIQADVSQISTDLEGTQSDLSSLTVSVGGISTRVESIEDNVDTHTSQISTINQTVGSIETRVETNEGNISTISQDVDSIETRVESAEGEISTISQDVSGISTRVSTAEGNISTISQDLNSIETRVETAEGNISTISQDVDSIETRVESAEGDISTISQDVDSIETRVESAEGDITSISQDLSGITTRVGTAEGNISTISQDVSSIDSRVTTTEGNVSSLTTSVNGISQRVTTAEGNITSLDTNVNSISGRVTTAEGNITSITADVSGLTTRVTDAEGDISAIDQSVDGIELRVSSTETNITNLQAQIDGAIQFWNGSDIPTLSNYPANEWTTEADRNNHRADIYTVIEDVQGELKQGKSYRFDKVNNTWQWIELTDNELSAVQALANSKAKVFYVTPIPPYNVNDLWLKDGKKLYRCKTLKDSSGSYSASDWEEAVEYTDDTVASLAQSLAQQALDAIDTTIKSVTVYYALGSSSSTAPTSGWSTTPPAWVQGKYMWQKTKTTYGDNTSVTSTPINISGAKGDTGSGGISVSSFTEYYAVSTSNSTAPADSSFSTNVPTMTSTNKYLWNYEVITYSNNTTSTTNKRVIGTYGDKGNKGDKGDKGNQGEKGDTGDNGVGISSIVNKYAVSTSNTTAPTSWSNTPPTMTTTNKYLWNYEIINYTDNTHNDTTPAVIGVYGDTGLQGIQRT